MSVTVVLPSALREAAAGRARIEVDGCATVADALEALRSRVPSAHARIVTERGEVRPHLNLFVGREDIRWLGGLGTPVPDGAELFVLRSVSGG